MKPTQKWNYSVLALTLCLFGAVAQADHGPDLVRVVPEKAFIPPGFDDNDNAQVVLTGTFSNSCYRVAKGRATVDKNNKRILIYNHAYYHSDAQCMMVLLPYMQTIDVGLVPAGTYKVLAVDNSNETHELGKMSVAAATSSEPDDFIYANVRDANVAPTGDPAIGAQSLSLNGTLSSDCFNLKEVKALYREDNVIEVLPITEREPGMVCHKIFKPFTATINLEDTWHGTTLVHIRSFSGQAHNKLIDMK